MQTKIIFCFWSTCRSIFSELLYLCNQYSACNHNVYTTCTQWLHHPSLYILVSAFCSLVSRPHLPQCILLFVHHFLSNFGFQKKKKKKKKPGGLVSFKWLVGPQTGKQLCVALVGCAHFITVNGQKLMPGYHKNITNVAIISISMLWQNIMIHSDSLPAMASLRTTPGYLGISLIVYFCRICVAHITCV